MKHHRWEEETSALGDGEYSVVLRCKYCPLTREWVGSNGTRGPPESPPSEFYSEEGCPGEDTLEEW